MPITNHKYVNTIPHEYYKLPIIIFDDKGFASKSFSLNWSKLMEIRY